MSHSHQHGARDNSDGHQHGHGDERRLLLAFALTAGFMVAEIAGGLIAGSLALLADAAHMLTDAASLGLAWVAARAARRPASPARSYGHHRFQVLAAFINAVTLMAVSAWIVVEAIRRLFSPVEVLGGLMLAVAVAGLIVNVAAFAILHGGSRENLNLRAAVLHVAGDLLGSVAAIVAALVILATGWMLSDPLLSVLVALLIVGSAWGIARKSWHVLMEGKPEAIDIGELRRVLTAANDDILDIHHVHVWTLNPGRNLVTLHVQVGETADHDRILGVVRGVLADRFGLDHSTIQVERNCPDADAKSDRAAEPPVSHDAH